MILKRALLTLSVVAFIATACSSSTDDDSGLPSACVTECDDVRNKCVLDCDDDSCKADCDTDRTECRTNCG
jgi:hypothetical protein